FFIFLGIEIGFHVAANAAPVPIRFLVPTGPYSLKAERALASVVEDFNRLNPGVKVTILKRGDEFSTLKELMALHLAGDPPEIAAIEPAEFGAIDTSSIGIRGQKLSPFFVGMKPWIQNLTKSKKGQWITLPFQLSIPILVADQEMIYRAHVDPEKLPQTWNGFVELCQKLAESLQKQKTENSGSLQKPSEEAFAVGFPLQGPRGLWIFEALAEKALWVREAGGVRSNRELSNEISVLQKLTDQPLLARPHETMDRALQSFLERRTPLLVATLDMLPYIASQATFRWSSVPLPKISGGSTQMVSGTSLLVTQDSKPVWDFLHFIYSPENAARWIAGGGFLSLKPKYESNSQWAKATIESPIYLKLLRNLDPKRTRNTDLEMVRSRTDWIQALHFLFSDKASRPSIDTILNQLDSHLTAR
ncbi:MAG: extracellular solute-binding protein, partial [Bdellovibrionota bacterium]